jgi:Lysylphosphatidylglycerol synthase TM region
VFVRGRAVDGCWSLAAAALSLLTIASLVAVPGLLGQPFTRALSTLSGAQPLWLWAAGGSFALALVCSGCAWRSGLHLCGGRIGRVEAGARYGFGSLVNSVLPGHAGEAVRVALFSRGLTGSERLWVASGIPAAIGAARALLLAVLVLAAAGSGVLPAWTALVLAGAGSAAVVICAWAGRRTPGTHRLARVLDVFRAVGRSPSAAVPLVGWVVCAVGARVFAVASVSAALGVRAPIGAALVIVPALAVAAFASLTPAGIRVTSGAVALVLHARGTGVTTALATGIAMNAVETAAGLTLGIASGLLLAFPSPAARRWTLVSAAAGACFTAVVLGVGGFADLPRP